MPNLIAHYNEALDGPEHDQIYPWMRKRHGVPNGYVYVDNRPHHFLFCGTAQAVLAQFNEDFPAGERYGLKRTGKNTYELTTEANSDIKEVPAGMKRPLGFYTV